jgi:formate hydrogenlyase transcriptional activator
MMSALTEYEWPGNVRELRNIIERAMILSSSSSLDLVDFVPVRGKTTETSTTGINTQQSESLEDIQRAHILRVLEECNWRVRGKDCAAERLGLKRTTLQSRMKRLGIMRPAVKLSGKEILSK